MENRIPASPSECCVIDNCLSSSELDKANKIGSKKSAYYDSTGMYKMESGNGCRAYLGLSGRAECIAIPQCKFMNSTVLDMYAEHTVYVGESLVSENNPLTLLGISGMCGLKRKSGKRIEWERNQPFRISGTHIPFDLWCLVGAVFGKALNAWRGIEGMDMRRMPDWMLVTYSEIFELLNPGCAWRDLSDGSRTYWRRMLDKGFDMLNSTSLMYDLPDGAEDDGTRNAYVMKSVLETTWIRRRAIGIVEEGRCMSEWGEAWKPFGVKVRLKGHPLFDFCWRHGTGNPALVQLYRDDYSCKRIFQSVRGWSKCFPVLFGAWIVQYRNYWRRRGGGFKTCELAWKSREMRHAFEGSVFEISSLSTSEMEKVLGWYAGKEGGRRTIRIASFRAEKRGEVSWEMAKSALTESVLVKNEIGRNVPVSEAGCEISEEMGRASSLMGEINVENSRHRVTIDGRRIETHESVIYRTEQKNGKPVVDDARNGRCYSMANGVQGIKRKDRGRIRIDGRRTVEVDYNSLHPNMLYALNGIDCGDDGMYEVGRGWHGGLLGFKEARRAVKMMLLRMINAKTQSNAIHSFKRAWNEEHGRAKEDFIPWLFSLYDAIMKRHRAIRHEFCSGKGTYLMSLDGRLIRNVCHRLAKDRICALGIHDSVIAREDFAWRVRRVMKEEYAKMFNGREIGVSFKNPGK